MKTPQNIVAFKGKFVNIQYVPQNSVSYLACNLLEYQKCIL